MPLLFFDATLKMITKTCAKNNDARRKKLNEMEKC